MTPLAIKRWCPNLGVYARHNEVRNEFGNLCLDLGLHVEDEEGPVGTNQRPADVLVQGLDGRPLAVDFAVVHTLQSSINMADEQPGKLTKQMENWKVKRKQALCASNGWSFLPFVMETIGSWGGKAKHLLQILIKQLALTHFCNRK